MKKKILYISMHPAPYRDPVIERLSKEYEVAVLSLYDIPTSHAEWNKQLHLPYKNTYLSKGIQLPVVGKLQLDILRYLKEYRGELIIIPGYVPATCLFAIMYANIHKIPYIYAADTADLPLDSAHRHSFNRIAKWCIRKSSALWVTGIAGRKTFEQIGYDGRDIIEGYYTLDNLKLRERYKSISNQQKSSWRNEYGIADNDKVFLFVGKLIPNRQIERMLRIVSLVHESHPDIKLLIIGDGPQKQIVDHMSEKNSWIINIPRVPYEELYQFYAMADAYLYVGAEPYSLAVVEAVIADLPVIASDTVGAAYDYVLDGVNGYVNKSDDEFVKAMEAVMNNQIEIEQMVQYNDSVIEAHGVEKILQDVDQLVQSLLLRRDG